MQLGENVHVFNQDLLPLRINAFAVLKCVCVSVSCCRGDGADSVLDSLEVVTLSNNVPVRKFAEQHELRVHEWPRVESSGQFDVGVVVSFGCLLQESLINTFP